MKLAPLGIAYNDHGGKLLADKVVSDQETLIGVKIEKSICNKAYLRSALGGNLQQNVSEISSPD